MSTTRLSVNLNKVALIRNARGGTRPDLYRVARDCEAFGAQGITVHPRPDQRHARYDDLPALKELVTTEFNVEGNPTRTFLDHVIAVRPHQCTLVPDAPDALTSDAGWNTVKHHDFLVDTIAELHEAGVRVSIFTDPDERQVEGAKAVGSDRIELYTGPYAEQYATDPARAVAPYAQAATRAAELELGVNAGHDLDLDNLRFLKQNLPVLDEVSIGHALISDALYMGLHNTIQQYLLRLEA